MSNIMKGIVDEYAGDPDDWDDHGDDIIPVYHSKKPTTIIGYVYQDEDGYWDSEAINSEIGHGMFDNKTDAIIDVHDMYNENLYEKKYRKNINGKWTDLPVPDDAYSEPPVDENLHKWFKEKWVRFGPDGKIRGPCARDSDSEGKPKCLPQKKAQNLGKKGRKYAASKKRREDPNPERSGKAINVATKKKKKTNESANRLFVKKLNSEKELIEHAKLFSRNLKLDGVPITVRNRYFTVCSTIFAHDKNSLNESVHLSSGKQLIKLLSRLDQFSQLPIKVGYKVAIINAQLQGDSVELWGFTIPKTISKIYMDPAEKTIKQFEFNNDPDDVWPRTENAEYNGNFLMYSAFFGDKKSADHALTMIMLQGSGDLDVRNHIHEQHNKKNTNESAYEKDLQDNEPRLVTGIYGTKSKEFKKKFRNQRDQDRFFDHPDREGNYEIHYVQKLDEGEVIQGPWGSKKITQSPDIEINGDNVVALGNRDLNKIAKAFVNSRYFKGMLAPDEDSIEEVADDVLHFVVQQMPDLIDRYDLELIVKTCRDISEKVHELSGVKPFNKDMTESCPSCGGELVDESMMNEKQDACYRKVKSRYKVWPSAYASGALVQCRKKGASNWGNKTESTIMKGIMKEEDDEPVTMYVNGKAFTKFDNLRQAEYEKRKLQKRFPYIDITFKKTIGMENTSVVYIDGNPMLKFKNSDDAKNAIKKMKQKYPHKKYEIRQETLEDYTGEFAAEKTPAVNPYGGLKDPEFRGAISENSIRNEHGFDVRSDILWPAIMFESTEFGTEFSNWLDSYRNSLGKPEKNSNCILAMVNYIGDSIVVIYGDATYIGENDSHYKLKIPSGAHTYSKHNQLVFDSDKSFKHFLTMLKLKFGEIETSVKKMQVMETPDTSGPVGTQPGGWRTYKNKPAGISEEELDEKCWSGYKQLGNKLKSGKLVPNCVKKESTIMKGIRR